MNLNYTKNKFIGILTNDKEGHHYEGIQNLEKLQSKKFKPKIMKKLAEGSKKCNIIFLFIFHMVTNASFSIVISLTHIDLQTLLNNRTYSPSSSMCNLYASLTHAHRNTYTDTPNSCSVRNMYINTLAILTNTDTRSHN